MVTPGRHGLEAPSCQHAHPHCPGRSGSGCPFPTPAQWQLLLLHFHSSSFRHPTKQGSAQRSPSPSGPLFLRPAPPPSQLANCLEGAEALQRWPLRFALLKCSRARNDRVIHRQEQRGQQCSTEGQHHFGSSTASTPSSRSPWPSLWQSTPREVLQLARDGLQHAQHCRTAQRPFRDPKLQPKDWNRRHPTAGSSVGREQRSAPGGLKAGLRAPVTVLSSGAQDSCEKGHGEKDCYCSTPCG